jgi:hypothetical protein
MASLIQTSPANGAAQQIRAPLERRGELIRRINLIDLRVDTEPVHVSAEKVKGISSAAISYFSWLTGRDYPMPEVKVVDTQLVGHHASDPSTVVIGRRGSKSVTLHEIVHHLRWCIGITNDLYQENPYVEEMATQFIQATVFSKSMDYSSVVSDIYSNTPSQMHKLLLDLLAFQETSYAVRTIVADGMDLSSEKTQKTFFRRAVYDLGRDRKIPKHFDNFNRFEYIRYPIARAMATMMYSRCLDTEKAAREMLLLSQRELTDRVISVAQSSGWEFGFFPVVAHLKKKLEQFQPLIARSWKSVAQRQQV